MSFKGIVVFEYAIPSITSNLKLYSAFWLNDYATLGLNLVPVKEEDNEIGGQSFWLQLDLGLCLKKLCPTISDNCVSLSEIKYLYI
jgi:hypothetical protein